MSVQREVEQLESKAEKLESEVQRLEQGPQRLRENSRSASVVLILFGDFCTLWAQNTGRNPWLWFFLGVFFSVVSVLFLLSKNAADLREKQADELEA